MSFDENLFDGNFSALVSSERRSVSDLRPTSSFPIFCDSSFCFLFNSFNSEYFSNIWSDLAKILPYLVNVAWILLLK